MFSPEFVCAFVNNITQKSYGQILMKFSGYVQDTSILNFGSHPDRYLDLDI